MKNFKKFLTLVSAILLVVTMNVGPVMAAEVYVVQTGDVLWKIARDNNTTWESLAEINNLTNPNLIFTGQELKLAATEVAEVVEETYIAENVEVMSRGTKIPAVFTYPSEGTNF